ncbi:hypothetical protein ACVWXS_002513 [Lysinibacillus sp. TE18511]
MNTFIAIFPLIFWLAIFGGIIFGAYQLGKRKSRNQDK